MAVAETSLNSRIDQKHIDSAVPIAKSAPGRNFWIRYLLRMFISAVLNLIIAFKIKCACSRRVLVTYH